MEKFIEKILDLGVSVGAKLLYTIILLIVGLKLIKWGIKLIKNSKLIKKIDQSLASFILSFIKVLLYVLLFMTIASTLGVPLTSFITILGSAGVAIGLALQGGLSNIAGGIIILLFKPFQVGDFVDTHADSGTVKAINLFYTVLVTADNCIISIPNGNLANQPTVNYSKNKVRRLDIDFTISYKNDAEQVKKVLKELLNDKRIITDKNKNRESFIGITNYLDSSVVYSLRVWVDNSDFGTLKTDLLEKAKVLLEKNKIEIPYPQLDVHLDK